jgi:hypothetical protein
MKKLPPAFVIGLVFYLLHDAGNLLFVTPTSIAVGVRWTVMSGGLNLAAHLLIAAGFFELVRTKRTAALVLACWTFTAFAAWLWVRPLLEILGAEIDHAVPYPFMFAGGVLTVSSVALVIAANGLRRAPVASVLVLVAVVGYGWVPVAGESIYRWLAHHHAFSAVYWLVQGAMWAAGTLMLAGAIDLPEEAADPAAAVRGLRLLERALKLRVVCACAVAALGVGTVAAPKLELGVGIVVLATMVLAALGCLQLARSKVDGLPREHVVIGAGIIAWWAGVQLLQLMYTTQRFFRDYVEAWAIAGPLVGVAGLVVIGIAISAFARARALEALREAASARLVIYALLAGSGIVIASQAYKASTASSALVLMMLGAGAGIAGLITFAGLARQAAAAADQGPGLPEARVVSTSPP